MTYIALLTEVGSSALFCWSLGLDQTIVLQRVTPSSSPERILHKSRHVTEFINCDKLRKIAR